MKTTAHDQIKQRIVPGEFGRAHVIQFETSDGSLHSNINFARFHQSQLDKNAANIQLEGAIAKELAGKGIVADATLYRMLTNEFSVRFTTAITLWQKHTEAKYTIGAAEANLLIALNNIAPCRSDFYWALPQGPELQTFTAALKAMACESLKRDGHEIDALALVSDTVIAGIAQSLKHATRIIPQSKFEQVAV